MYNSLHLSNYWLLSGTVAAMEEFETTSYNPEFNIHHWKRLVSKIEQLGNTERLILGSDSCI